MADSANEDVKAKMREALERKRANEKGRSEKGHTQEKVHGAEVAGGAVPRMHRRKSGES
jgi:hypothetical protein